MAVNQVGSTTTIYSSSVGVSSTTPSSSTTAVSSTTSGTRTSSTTSTTVKLSSATAKTTCSTTMSYSGASSTARVSSTTASTTAKVSSTTASVVNRVTSSTGASIANSTKVSATSKVSSTTASTTVYPYLSHLGGEALKQIENALYKLGFDDDNEDGLYMEALKKFKDAAGLSESSEYSSEVIAKLDKISEMLKVNEDFGEQLEELGFYNRYGGEVEATSVQANAAPNNLLKSLENFCSIYNVEYNLDSLNTILEKINDVHSYYNDILNSEKTENTLNIVGTSHGIQKINFGKSWTFLKLGMGFSDELTSAVLANWYEEGGFSETNKEDKRGEKFLLDDSATYKFKTTDGIGFGIMQWTYFSRKEEFLEIAEQMDSGVGNINVQFALFKSEISEGGSQHRVWESVLSKNNLDEYTREFLLEVENPKFDNVEEQKKEENERIGVAKAIYEGMAK